MCPEQGTGEGEGRAGRLQASDASRLGTQREGGGVGEGGGGEGGLGRDGRLQASDPREAFHARPQVSCFQGSGFRFRFGV